VLGKFILALYLGSGAAASGYGAASSLITLLLWIHYAAQILLFGEEFTQVSGLLIIRFERRHTSALLTSPLPLSSIGL
jgi:uncharacterized BrkB/YihY/UPF0761 family membrane protein